MLVAASIAYAAGRSVWAKHTRAREARVEFLALCEREASPASCEARAAAHHDECFSINDKYGTKTSVAHLETQDYQRCVMVGPEAWQTERQRGRRQRAAERENLGLPP